MITQRIVLLSLFFSISCCRAILVRPTPKPRDNKHHEPQLSAVAHAIAPIGRLGDQLLAYIHTKWFAYRHNLKMYYWYFPYSSDLALSQHETLCSHIVLNQYMSHIMLDRSYSNHSLKKYNTLYMIPWFTHFYCDSATHPMCFDIDWYDPAFKKMIQADISPCNPALAQAVKLPTGCLTIAVHVRKGGGFDAPLLSKTVPADIAFPHKFPPDSYYIEQLNYLIAHYKDIPIHIHIFTDDPNPAQIAKKYHVALSNQKVTFGYRAEGNHHTKNVLEDFFAMARCDCLIMPASNLSYVASRIGNHKITIMPKHHYWDNNRLIIDEVEITQRR